MLKNIASAYKKILGRTVTFTRKAVKLPVKPRYKLRYVKIYAKAGMFDGLYAIPPKGIYYQTLFINSRSWDCLIILDACRYDFFEKYVWKFMDGRLYRVLSPGGYTIKWFKRTWYGNYKDVIYISSTPFIRKSERIRKKFLKIVNAWDRGWDEKLHTIPPWKMNSIALWELKLLNVKHRLGLYAKRPRIVIHYVQPHSPYIAGPIDFSRIYDFYIKNLRGVVVLEHAVLVHLMNILGDVEKVNYTLRRAYEENLKLVLSYVSELVPYLPGRVAITSDHGELLGEYGLYFHPIDAMISELRYVPLFIVK